MKIFILIFLSLFVLSCQTGGNWSARELQEWYIGNQETDSQFISPLFYQGSDEKYHHFICRSMDKWVPVKVNKEQINISDVRPYDQTSKNKSFPGYFIVEPKKGFEKVTESKKLSTSFFSS
jgi:hypothetical protein